MAYITNVTTISTDSGWNYMPFNSPYFINVGLGPIEEKKPKQLTAKKLNAKELNKRNETD